MLSPVILTAQRSGEHGGEVTEFFSAFFLGFSLWNRMFKINSPLANELETLEELKKK